MAVTGKLKIGEAVSFTEDGKSTPTIGIVIYDPNEEGETATVLVLLSVSDEREIAKSSIVEKVNLSDFEKTLNRRALGTRGRPDPVARADLDRIHRLRMVQKIAPTAHANYIKTRPATPTTETVVEAATETVVTPTTETVVAPTVEAGETGS